MTDSTVTPAVITSTSGLIPDGILGYAKGIAVTTGAILTAVAEVIPDSQPWKRYLQAGILVCTIVATIAVPNAVKPAVVTPPLAVNPPRPVITGVTTPPEVVGEPVTVDDPPGRHEVPPAVD